MRCSICDHVEGYGSFSNPLGNPRTKVRYRPKLGEDLCDECAQVIHHTIVEDDSKRVKTIEDIIDYQHDQIASKYTHVEST